MVTRNKDFSRAQERMGGEANRAPQKRAMRAIPEDTFKQLVLSDVHASEQQFDPTDKILIRKHEGVTC